MHRQVVTMQMMPILEAKFEFGQTNQRLHCMYTSSNKRGMSCQGIELTRSVTLLNSVNLFRCIICNNPIELHKFAPDSIQETKVIFSVSIRINP